ncbi:Uncharacterised protein [Mycobacteroides abscessus subsp. abscessus]|nr:Uncharacterised protein [Mycobacteroides abscessus subsp. abscessus]
MRITAGAINQYASRRSCFLPSLTSPDRFVRFDDVAGRSRVAVDVPPPDRVASERAAAPTTVACAAVGVSGADFSKDGVSEDGVSEDGVLDVGAACSGALPVG